MMEENIGVTVTVCVNTGYSLLIVLLQLQQIEQTAKKELSLELQNLFKVVSSIPQKLDLFI